MVLLKGDGGGEAGDEICEDGRRLVGEGGVETQVVGQLVHCQLEGVVDGAAYEVGEGEDEGPGGGGEEVGEDELSGEEGDDDGEGEGLHTKEGGDLGVLCQYLTTTSGVRLIGVGPREVAGGGTGSEEGGTGG